MVKFEVVYNLMDVEKGNAYKMTSGNLCIGCPQCALPISIPKDDWNGDITKINITHQPNNSIQCPCGAHYHIVDSEITA